jgi:hypothetical protein
MDYTLVNEEIKRAKKMARPFSEEVAPIYKMFDWWWYRLGAPPTKDDIYKQIIYFLDSLEINDNTKDTVLETGGIGISITLSPKINSVLIDIYLKISADVIEATTEL